MLSLILATALAQNSALPTQQTLEPTDDVWIYQYAQEQASDPFLRAWGGEEGAVGKSFEGSMGFSYSCLKFELPKQPVGTALKGAKLLLTHAGEPGWEPKDSEKHPIEVRPLAMRFQEAGWKFEDAKKVHPEPGEDKIFGTGWANPGDDKPFVIEIDLMKGKANFAEAYKQAIANPDRVMCFALTTTMVPEGAGENTIYKLYSRNNENREVRPKLVLSFGP